MIYAKLGGILAVILVIFALGYRVGEMPYKAKYEALQAADWKGKAQGEELAKETLAKQLVQVQATSENNADVMLRLANENAKTVQDRDATVARVHRLEQLLAATATRTSPDPQMPQAGRGPVTANSSGDTGVGRIGELLIAARNEARRNATRLNALVAEITPQLESLP